MPGDARTPLKLLASLPRPWERTVPLEEDTTLRAALAQHTPLQRFFNKLWVEGQAKRDKYQDSLDSTLWLCGAVVAKLGFDCAHLITGRPFPAEVQIMPVLFGGLLCTRFAGLLYRRLEPRFAKEQQRAREQLEGGVLRLALEPEAWLRVPGLRSSKTSSLQPAAASTMEERLKRLLEHFDQVCEAVGLIPAGWKTRLRRGLLTWGPALIYFGSLQFAGGNDFWTSFFILVAIHSVFDDLQKMRKVGIRLALCEVLEAPPAFVALMASGLPSAALAADTPARDSVTPAGHEPFYESR